MENDDGTMWFCYHCRISFTAVKKMICRVTKLEQKHAEICDKHEQMSKRLEELENVDIDAKIREALIEQKESENKKIECNVFWPS